MRLFLFVFLHVLVFLFLLVTHPEASEDGWEIDEWNEYLVLSKNGEVVHGDKMRFALNYNNCESVSTMFTFMTTRAPKDIYQFEKKRLPIKINNVPITAEVLLVRPFYKNFGYLVAFTLGTFDLKKYSNNLSVLYLVFKFYYELLICQYFLSH